MRRLTKQGGTGQQEQAPARAYARGQRTGTVLQRSESKLQTEEVERLCEALNDKLLKLGQPRATAGR